MSDRFDHPGIGLHDMATSHRSMYVAEDGSVHIRYDYTLHSGETGVIDIEEQNERDASHWREVIAKDQPKRG